MSRGAPVVRVAALVACLTLIGCAASEPAYRHSRYDYWAFRGRAGRLVEPNYLPYVTHWEDVPGVGPALVLCRWPDAAFPLAYFVELPDIPQELQDEFRPRDPRDYAEAVVKAFRRWEEAIGRPVRFRRVDDPEAAVLRVRIDAVMRSVPEGLVGGAAGAGGDHCRVLGRGPNDDRAPIAFGVHDLTLFVVDSVGLLTPGQVERIALHEIGHALGASGQHSPLGGDVMFHVSNDSRVEVLSIHDKNTFRSLYRLPPGAIYARMAERHAQPLPEALRAPPRLDRSVRDARFDLEVRFPVGWQRVRTPRGWIAVDGVTWDYAASLQVIAVREKLRDLVARQLRRARMRSDLARSDSLELDGEPIARVIVEAGGVTEETSMLQWGDEWVLLIVADCRTDTYAVYQGWFRTVLLSLDRLDAATRPSGVGSGPVGPLPP